MNNMLMRSLPMVATVLGNKYGVQVEVGGLSAYTDGDTIHLPGLPAESNKDTLDLVRGFLDHESAHIRETDFEVLKNENLKPITKSIWNIIEDWRVEHALSHRFPGCRTNFNWLIENQFSTPPEAQEEVALEVVNYILYSVRVWDVSSLDAIRDQLGRVVRQHYPELFKELNALLNQVKTNCRSTTEAMGYAKQFVKLIEKYAKQQPKTQSNPQKGGKKSDKSRDDQANSPQSGGEEMEDKKDKNGDQNGSVCSSTDSPNHDHNLTENPGEDGNKLGKLLNLKETQLPADLGSKLSNELEKLRAHTQSGMSIAVVGQKRLEPLETMAVKKVARSSVALHTKLSSLLQSSVMKRSRPSRSGKLNPKRVARMSFDTKLFQRHEIKQGMNSNIHILLDCSGSMRSRIDLATESCFSMANSLSKINGVKVAVSAFPADSGESKAVANGDCDTVFPVLKYGDSMHHNFKMKATGTTPLGAAIWWALQNEPMVKENRKIILVITDGRPDYMPNTAQAIAHGRKLGFEFYGIGIADPYIKSFLPNHHKVITKLDELAPAMFTLLQKALLTNNE